MAGHTVSSFGFLCISYLIGGVISLPLKEFGSNDPFPAWSDYSSPGSAYPKAGDGGMVFPYGRAMQEPYAKADGGVYSNEGSDMDAGDSVWAKNGGMDSGSDGYYPVPEGYSEEQVPSMEVETPEVEEPVLSDVSDLDPVYHFSSRSRYQQGRRAFFLTRYNPGEPTVNLDTVSDPVYIIITSFGSKIPSPALTDLSVPGTAHPKVGESSLVDTSRSTSQDDYDLEGPLPGSRHSGHRNTEAGLYKPTPEGSEASHLVDYEELV
ncbi:uncharacterized protein LOC132470775 [Gadus macrocephalus]|uniref:uncharacterized protein LOC132470775 n=1 Tax=Gadus macrocephalus TaxID=80720 RepID=UPI0028CB1FFD|nr:uncharacterized protein LOC132470775 [Gadus macrocephalus]